MKSIELIIPEALQPSTSRAATTGASSSVNRHDWHFDAYHPELAQVLPAVKAFCIAVLEDQEPRWLTILGTSGIGKTHILTQAFRFLRRHWTLEKRTQWPDGTWTGRMRQHAHVKPTRDLDTYHAPADYAEFDLVYVEDIGSGQGLEKGAGAVTKSRLAELLQLRSNKWTICDSNMSRKDIAEHVDPRIASRLTRDFSVCIEISDEVPDYAERNVS